MCHACLDEIRRGLEEQRKVKEDVRRIGHAINKFEESVQKLSGAVLCHRNQYLQGLINIYYCMTGRAIQGNIQFEGGSIGPPQGGTIHNPRTEYSPVLSDPKGMQ